MLYNVCKEKKRLVWIYVICNAYVYNYLFGQVIVFFIESLISDSLRNKTCHQIIHTSNLFKNADLFSYVTTDFVFLRKSLNHSNTDSFKNAELCSNKKDCFYE